MFRGLLVLNALALVYIQGVNLNYQIAGYNFADFPVATHILCLFLGLSILGFSTNSLDVIMFGRLRSILISNVLGTDLVNLTMAHLKGHGIWADLISPKYIGYQSNRLQQVFAQLFKCTFIILYIVIFFFSIWSLISLFLFGLSRDPSICTWANVISGAGIMVGILGVVLFFGTQFVKFKYTLYQPNNLDSQMVDKMIS